MKKLFAGLALTATLGIGGVLVFGEIGNNLTNTVNETTDKITEAVPEVEINVSGEVEASNAPTERTVDLGSNKPWEYFSSDDIKNKQTNGEVIYLFSDSQDIENAILAFSLNGFEELQDESKNPFGNSKDKMSRSWANYLDGFIQGVSQYHPDKEVYFEKMREVRVALETLNYESIPSLLEEAKQLREAK